jgi:putative two-component system response regulator
MRTVLIVDDEADFLKIARIIVQRAGYMPLIASSADQALALLDQHMADIILMDDMMPGMTGGELCQQLKSDARYQHIPVVMHSAGPRVRNPAFLQQINADGFLPKPAQPQDMVQALKHHLES